ncbi:hypothetical protein P9847_23285 [Paenibacillus chibensis]|uniref:DUF3396 domain-containing protein n=1 Tax=Paenibacillus chibensis TaxID=59846 RepID=A0ABU6PZ92_9BACL|nr:hypothetical protein [Paenibacillus chibensis]
MRAALKQAIAGIVPLLKDRLYDVQPPADGALEPFGIISFGEELWKSSWAGYRQMIRLKLYAGSSGMDQVDAWAEDLAEGLHRRRIASGNERPFRLYYFGSREGERAEAASGQAYRSLRFGIYIPEAEMDGDAAATVTDDWLNALLSWTRAQLGDAWSVYPTAWPSGPTDTSVLWRMAGTETKMAGASLYEIRRRFVGHVIGRNAVSEQRTAAALVEMLGSKVQLPMDTDARKHMSVSEVSADLQADGFLDGQIQLTLVQRRVRPAEEAALIRSVELHPILK